MFGLTDLSKLVYKAKEIYDAHRKDLEKETDEATFTALYEQYEAFDGSWKKRFSNGKKRVRISWPFMWDEHLSDFVDTINPD